MKEYSMNTFKNGNGVDFWTWYYKGKFKKDIEFFWNGKRDYKEELEKHYNRLLKSKEYSINNLNSEDYILRHSANGLLNQLKAIESILNN